MSAADASLQLAAAQNVFANGTTVDSTDWIDMRAAADWGGGRGLAVEIIVVTAFAGGTSAQFQVLAVDAAGSNAVVLDTTAAIPVASLPAGTRIPLRLSPKGALPTSTLTHLRLRCVNVGNNTAGAVSAQVVHELSTQNGRKAVGSGF